MNWQTIDPVPQDLGGSPFWHPTEKMLYWVDTVGKKILRTNAYGSAVQTWAMPSEPGCIAPAKSGGLVIALRHGVFRAHEWAGALVPIATLSYDSAYVRANDGKCDARGRFWVGTVDETKASYGAALYCIDCRAPGPAVVQKKANEALISNGLAWSPDGTTLYWADTSRHLVHAWDYEATGNTLASHRTFIKFAAKPVGWTYQNMRYQGSPFGAAVDALGNYYCAMYEGRLVCKFSPDGTLLGEIPTPAQCPTMPCFGGEDLKTLFLTTSRHARSEEELQAYPGAGCVFAMQVDTPGLPVNFFAD